ncbi:unnamed protein product [Spodoptera littoralis]|uniref:Cytochrome P450 n=1 Tax=Spodoptera littoralis TaxID=7109 RepID=A0A9P0N991_SPOLI|nr:unnamed protein product [Spodoptera littoralis]
MDLFEMENLHHGLVRAIRRTTAHVYRKPSGKNGTILIYLKFNPAQFGPERFIRDEKSVITDIFMQFGVGQRMCIRNLLARMELFLFISNLMIFKLNLQTFTTTDMSMPFGIGQRMCIGNLLARMELFLLFPNLMSHLQPIYNIIYIHIILYIFMEPEQFRAERFIRDEKSVITDIFMQFGIEQRMCVRNLLARMGLFYYSQIKREHFKPDGFIRGGKFTITDLFVQFGVRQRMCIGNLLARMELFLFISNLIMEPEKFGAERFIRDEKSVITDIFITTDMSMPFGIGQRMCIGNLLARMELFLLFPNLITGYERALYIYIILYIFMEPEQFRAERFIRDEKSVITDIFMQFGIEQRMCVRNLLARMGLFLLFSNLMNN